MPLLSLPLNLTRRNKMVLSPAKALKWVAFGYITLEVMAFSAPRHHSTRSMRGTNNIIGSRGNNGNLWMAGKDGGNDNVDPNPGGLNQWDDDDENNKKSFKDLSFIEQIQEWFASDEGKEDVKTYTSSLAIALLLRLLIVEPRYIPSLSMYPTFEVGDQLAVEKVTKRIRSPYRNEVVVFNPPQNFRNLVGDGSKKAKEALIKRIVAVEVSIQSYGMIVCLYLRQMLFLIQSKLHGNHRGFIYTG